MPPKPKYTREEIIQAAFDIACRSGIDAVVAREVGKQLGTSPTPIFTFFTGMDELKAEVRSKASQMLIEYLNGVFDYKPAFKEFGMRWVRFAVKNPELYRMLFQPTGGSEYTTFITDSALFQPVFLPVIAEAARSFNISQEDASELMKQLLIHSNGIASFCLNDKEFFTDEQISRSISEVCIGLVISSKLRDGSFDPELGRRMANFALMPSLPQKIK